MTFLGTPLLGFCCYQFAGGATTLRIISYPNKSVTAKPADFQLNPEVGCNLMFDSYSAVLMQY
jgi:hypothetical protein